MKRTILIVLASYLCGYTATVSAQEVKDKQYYSQHMEEARKFAKECHSTKRQFSEANDQCQDAKSTVWLYDHSSRPVVQKK